MVTNYSIINIINFKAEKLNNALNAYQSVLLAFYVIVGQLLSKAGENASLMRSFLTALPVRDLTEHRMPRNNVITSIIQTEAERRRREAGVQQLDGKWAWIMYVCMFICLYVFRKYLAI